MTDRVNPPLQERAIGWWVDCLRKDTRISGICCFGSLATGAADAYSDLDLGLLVADEQIAGFASSREVPEGVAPVAAMAPCPGDENCILVLHRFGGEYLKVDYNYFSARTPLPWYGREVRVLFDRDGALDTISRRSRDAPGGSEPDYGLVAMLLWNAVRMVQRGELMEAVDVLAQLRDPLLTGLVCQRYGRVFLNYRRVESTYPPEVVDMLRRTYAGPDTEELWRAIAAVLDVFRRFGLSDRIPGQVFGYVNSLLAERGPGVSGIHRTGCSD
ncbi:MAG: hypothetical protein ABIK96_12830 [bacterium]